MNKLLVVDDDHIFHFIVKACLRQSTAFDAMYIDNGTHFINFLERLQIEPLDCPDVILLDLHMAGIDGWGLLDVIRDFYALFNKRVMVYVVSASIDARERKRALTYPFVKDFVCKPLGSDFFNTVSDLLEKQWRSLQNYA